MALDLKLIGITYDDARGNGLNYKAEKFDAHLGVIHQLPNDPRFREIPMPGAPNYVDYGAIFTPEEIIALATAAKSDNPSLQQLKDQVTKYDLVVAHIYEWDTGLG